MLINGTEKVGIKILKNSTAFIDYSQTIDDVYENFEDYNPTKKRRVLTMFLNMIADMEFNKKLSPIVTELILRGIKLSISIVFIWQSYFKVSKTIRLNATHCLIVKIPNKRESQQMASNHLSDIDFIDLMKHYKDILKKHIHF